MKKVYDFLFERYGYQGWWPVLSHSGNNPTKSGSMNGYHPGDYTFPKNEQQKFEICVGAILTQNTNWQNVEKALLKLDEINALSPRRILKLDDKTLKNAIRSAGYFNQKAMKLRAFAKFFLELKRAPTRDELLCVWGIGNETADSILLYAYKQSEFVVDAYTKRILLNLDLISEKETYDEIKNLFESNLPEDYQLFQEFHALLVEHAKRHYMKNSPECPLKLRKDEL